MAKIFCIANQKGGVGKTTTTVNLAAGLAKIGQRVLMVDLDPQGNATMGSGVDKRAMALSVYDVLLESATVAEAAVFSDKCGYHVLGANRELAGAEVELVDVERREKRLKSALASVESDYDFILIDCPPSLSMLTLNGLCSAHGVIVPMQCEYFALEGLTDLVNTIKQVHANLNPELQIIGLLRVMFDPRITLQQQVSDQLKSHFGDKVFDTVIPRNVRLAEAPSYGLPGVVLTQRPRAARPSWLLPAKWWRALGSRDGKTWVPRETSERPDPARLAEQRPRTTGKAAGKCCTATGAWISTTG